MNAGGWHVALVAALLAGTDRECIGASFNGYVEGALTTFIDHPQFDQQVERGVRPSTALKLDYNADLAESWGVVGSFFSRLDPWADDVLHADIRDAYAIRYGENTELRAGVFTEYWGVLEGFNIVDVINYRDLVEDFKGKTKLGQVGVDAAGLWDGGRFDFYFLTLNRGQRLADEEDRFRFTGLPLRSPEFQGGRWRPSVAGRVSLSGDQEDIFISHFYGASREARLEPDLSDPFGPPEALVPDYDLINQTAIEAQAVRLGAVWKLEAFRRTGNGPTFFGVGSGVEREFPRAFGGRGSLTGYLETYFDTRNEDKSPSTSFDHDVFVGARYAFNDIRSSELFVKSFIDLKNGGTLLTIEGSTRLDPVTLLLEADFLAFTDDDSSLTSFKDDSRIFLRARWNF